MRFAGIMLEIAMIKIRRFGLFVALVVLAGCATFGDRTVSISESQIQGKLNERLAIPISLLKIFDVKLSNALVRFDDATGRVHTVIDTHLASKLMNQTLAGKIAISGKLRFDAATNSVVLDDTSVEKLNFNGVDEKYNDALNEFAKVMGSELLNGLTLYTVKPEDLKIGSRQYYPKDMQVTGKGLVITLSPAQ